MIRLVEGEELHRDYWPAEVTWENADDASTVYRQARVFVTSRRVVLVALAHGRPSIEVEADLIPEARTVWHRNGVQGGRSSIVTSAGTFHVTAAHGCGCGSPLRAIPLPR